MHHGLARCHGRNAVSVLRAQRGAPDGIRKMAVPVEAGDHMPMQMRHPVAQRGEIDFGGRELLAQDLLHQHHGLHAVLALTGREVGEFRHMRVPDHAVERRMTRLVGMDHAQASAAPDEPPAVGKAQRALGHHPAKIGRAHV